jgi:hypothetical protein
MQEDPETKNSIETKLRYEKPVLITYGRVRDLTAGGTSSATESSGQGDCLMLNMSAPCPMP